MGGIRGVPLRAEAVWLPGFQHQYQGLLIVLIAYLLSVGLLLLEQHVPLERHLSLVRFVVISF